MQWRWQAAQEISEVVRLKGHCAPDSRIPHKVENNEHCQAVLKARMQEGNLPHCDIKNDVIGYEPEGEAKMAQAVLAGFPCQVPVLQAVSHITQCLCPRIVVGIVLTAVAGSFPSRFPEWHARRSQHAHQERVRMLRQTPERVAVAAIT